MKKFTKTFIVIWIGIILLTLPKVSTIAEELSNKDNLTRLINTMPKNKINTQQEIPDEEYGSTEFSIIEMLFIILCLIIRFLFGIYFPF